MCNYFVSDATQSNLYTLVCVLTAKNTSVTLTGLKDPLAKADKEYCALFQSKEQIPKVSLYKKNIFTIISV